MWRVSGAAVVCALTVLPALVGEEPHARSHGDPPAPAAPLELAPRDALARQIADELAAIDRAHGQVRTKLDEADAARARRIAAAYRIVRAPDDRIGRDPAASMAAARRRAAARLLLERDLAERRLLADEAAHLDRAAAARRADAVRLPELELPAELGRPAAGAVARRYGTIAHDRSKTTLARRGIDLEVEPQAPATAPADGVVRYAGAIRGLDAGVILDHGSFVTVVAKLGAVAVPVGAPVRRGDRIGRAARRRVYLEVRVKLGPGGLPVDPEPLLAPNASKPR